MSRPLRLEFEGALYHVTARGDRREDIYEDDTDRNTFLEIFGNVCECFGWLCHCYCLMSNHYHLVIETLEANLSKGMRQLNGEYSRKFNVRHKRVGHVFQGRYKSIFVEKENYLKELSRYVVLNPVRARMVSSAHEWKWSSYRALLDVTDSPSWLVSDWMLSQFGKDRSTAKRAYRQFVSEGLNHPSPWMELKNQLYLGSDDFVDKCMDRIEQEKHLDEIPRKQRKRKVALEKIDAGSKDRDQVITEAYESGHYSLKEIGDYFGLHYSRVSRIARGAKGKT